MNDPLRRITQDAEGIADDQDRMTAYAGCTYAYTANGELTTKTCGSEVTSYQYDDFGNLTHVVMPDGITIDYVIDARNRRVGKKVNGTLVEGFLYGDQLNPVAELDGSGAVVARFVYGTKANVPDYMVKGGVTYRYNTDQLGSVRLVVDAATGTIAQRIDYDEYGVTIQDTNPGFQPFGFAGGITDAHTGLVRFGARDYDPAAGRWTSKDPIDFYGGTTGLYQFAASDPLNWEDLGGLQPGESCPAGNPEAEWWYRNVYPYWHAAGRAIGNFFNGVSRWFSQHFFMGAAVNVPFFPPTGLSGSVSFNGRDGFHWSGRLGAPAGGVGFSGGLGFKFGDVPPGFYRGGSFSGGDDFGAGFEYRCTFEGKHEQYRFIFGVGYGFGGGVTAVGYSGGSQGK